MNGLLLGFACGAPSRSGRLCRRDELALLEQSEQLPRGFLRRLMFGVQLDLRVERWLIWVGDAGELLDLALERLLVEALHVALGADLDRGLDEHLDEAVAHHLAGLVADLAVWR